MSDFMNQPVLQPVREPAAAAVSRSPGRFLDRPWHFPGRAGRHVWSGGSGKAPGWADTALTKQNVVLALDGGGQVRVDVLADRLFRIRYSKTGKWTESGLNRYGVLCRRLPEVAFEKAEANGVHTLATKQAKLAIGASDGAITWRTPLESRSPNRPRAVPGRPDTTSGLR